MSNIIPPKTDELIDRHQFYATVACKSIEDESTIARIIGTQTRFGTKFDDIRDKVHNAETRNKTVFFIITIIWTVLGGSVGVFIQKSLTDADLRTTRIEKIERTMESEKVLHETLKTIPERFDSQKRNVETLQTQLDDITTRLNMIESKKR